MPTSEKTRTAVHENVSEDILAAVGIDGMFRWEFDDNASYIFVRDASVVFNGERHSCGVSVRMQDNGHFCVSVYSRNTDVYPMCRQNLTGAQLEDFFIELADI